MAFSAASAASRGRPCRGIAADRNFCRDRHFGKRRAVNFRPPLAWRHRFDIFKQHKSNGSSGAASAMHSTIMNYPLTLVHILERAKLLFPNVEIVSRRPDKSLHRQTYGDFYRRARAL